MYQQELLRNMSRYLQSGFKFNEEGFKNIIKHVNTARSDLSVLTQMISEVIGTGDADYSGSGDEPEALGLVKRSQFEESDCNNPMIELMILVVLLIVFILIIAFWIQYIRDNG